MESKKIKTMAEKLEEKSIVRPEAIALLFRAKTLIAGDIHGKISKAVYDAQQAQTVEDLNRLIADAMEIEDKMYSAGRSMSRVRYHLIAMKVDLLPKPKSEAADE